MEGTSNSAQAAETSDSSRGRKLRKLANFLECCICWNHLRNAHICGHCSQPFCRACIDQWLATKPNCPRCRQPLTEQTVVRDRTLDELGAVVNELQADEQQNRCCLHRREQLFFCFVCEESLCDRCTFEKVHLEHRDKVVLLDVAFDHYNKNMTADLEWIRNETRTFRKHETRMQEDEQLLETVFERVNATLRQTSESISSQYKEKLSIQRHSQELFKQRSSSVYAMHKKSIGLASQEKSAFALEQLIKFKKELKLFRSESFPINYQIKLKDLSFKNNVLPKPVQITFRLKKAQFYESTATGANGSVWKMKIFRRSSATPVLSSLLLEQGTPGAYWVACRGSPAKWYEFIHKTYVVLNIENVINACEYRRSDESLEIAIIIFQARAYTEPSQQDYINSLETRIADYEKLLAEFREKRGSLQLEDQHQDQHDSNRDVSNRT